MDNTSPNRSTNEHRAVVLESSASNSSQKNPVLISDNENEEESSSVNPIDFTTRDCRYCFESQNEEGTNPVMKVGCQCKGDNSNGHETCLVKWFNDKLLTSLKLECEICKGRLGAHLNSIILANSLPKDTEPGSKRWVPFVLVLLHVPMEDLNLLHVPIDTPAFDELSLYTKLEIEDSFEIQKQKHEDEAMKRIHVPKLLRDGARVDELQQQFIDMVYVIQTPGVHEFSIAFFPCSGGVGNDMNLKIVLHGFESRGEILRVPVSSGAQDLVLEELLKDLTEHVEWIIRKDECLCILPRCMIVDNVSSNLATPSAHRQFTYGRYYPVTLF